MASHLEDKLDQLMKVVPDRQPFRVEYYLRKLKISSTPADRSRLKGMLIVSYGYAEHDQTKVGRFVLTSRGRNCQKAGGHYKYKPTLLAEENAVEDKGRLERQRLQSEVEWLNQQIETYPKIQGYAYWANRIAIIAALIALGALMVDIVSCNRTKKQETSNPSPAAVPSYSLLSLK